MKTINKARRAIETLCRREPTVYRLGGWIGKELEITMQNLDKAYISFEINDADTKYRIKTTFCFPELNGKIVEF
jgi:hypothetical protein